MELVGLPSPAGWSCAALAEPAEPSPGAVGRAESSSTSCCVWGHGGYQTIAPQAASPASPTTGKTGSRGAIIEKIVGREESPSATCSVFIFSAATPFPHASPTLPLFPHLHPFPLHSFPISPLTLLFYLPFSSLSPSHASPSYFLSSLHPVFSHLWGKHHLLPYFLCLMLAALCHCSLRLFSISSHLSCSHPLFLVSCADEWPRKPKRQSLPLSPHPHKVPHQDLVPAPRRESRSRDFTATPNPKKHLRFWGG